MTPKVHGSLKQKALEYAEHVRHFIVKTAKREHNMSRIALMLTKRKLYARKVICTFLWEAQNAKP